MAVQLLALWMVNRELEASGPNLPPRGTSLHVCSFLLCSNGTWMMLLEWAMPPGEHGGRLPPRYMWVLLASIYERWDV